MTDGELGKIAWSAGGGDRAGDGARSGRLVRDGMRKRARVLSGSRPDPHRAGAPTKSGQAGGTGRTAWLGRRLEVCDGEERAWADFAFGTGTGAGDQPGRRAERAETVRSRVRGVFVNEAPADSRAGGAAQNV